MFNFEKLTVYQRSVGFCKLIYNLTKKWPKEELFGLTSQVRRAAVSILLNISEGSNRNPKEFRHFLDMARGSCLEVAAILQLAKELEYLPESEYNQLYQQAIEISKMISALKRAIK